MEIRNILGVLIGLSLLLSVLPIALIAQTPPPSESQRLTIDAFEYFKKQRFDESVQTARRVVEIERGSKPVNLSNLATALLNLALLQKEHYWHLRGDLANPNLLRDASITSYEKRIAYAKSIPLHFSEVISILEGRLRIETVELANAKFELANFETKSIRLDFTGKSKISELSANFAGAIAIYSRLLGDDDDQTSHARLIFADLLKSTGDIEMAIPVVEAYIAGVKKRHGGKSALLVPGLRSLCLLSTSIFDLEKMTECYNLLKLITEKDEPYPEPTLDLSFRAKKDHLETLIKNPDTATTGKKMQKYLLVNVVIDEKGSVIDAKPASSVEKDMFGASVSKSAAQNVLEWKFHPYSKDRISRQMRGVVWFPYLVKS